MAQNKTHHITLRRTSLILILLMATAGGGLLTWLLFNDRQTVVDPAPQSLISAPTIASKAPPKIKKETASPKSAKKQAATPPSTDKKKPGSFVIKGLISTAGEPWSPRHIRVKLLWLKNKGKQQLLLGHENALLQMTQHGLAYQITLKSQPANFVSFNGGVEGNIARVIAFVDHQNDGSLTAREDRIIAVSKEVLRYRTGRYDGSILNDIQQQNIRRAGRGYVFIRNEPDDLGKLDWRVVADKSPVRLDLNAAETSLPAMYNTFLKLL